MCARACVCVCVCVCVSVAVSFSFLGRKESEKEEETRKREEEKTPDRISAGKTADPWLCSSLIIRSVHQVVDRSRPARINRHRPRAWLKRSATIDKTHSVTREIESKVARSAVQVSHRPVRKEKSPQKILWYSPPYSFSASLVPITFNEIWISCSESEGNIFEMWQTR